MLTLFLLAAAVLAIALLAASRRPDAFRVERRIHIEAPVAQVEPLVGDMRRFMTWNPFAKDKPLALDFSGPAGGTGAACDFAGSGAAGRGRLEVIDSRPGKITMRLTMAAPVRCENTIEFLLVPGAAGTDVSWAMHGRSPLIAKFMGLLFDTDNMVGRELESGLADLKALAEAAGAIKAA
jgi:hypothetical protein